MVVDTATATIASNRRTGGRLHIADNRKHVAGRGFTADRYQLLEQSPKTKRLHLHRRFVSLYFDDGLAALNKVPYFNQPPSYFDRRAGGRQIRHFEIHAGLELAKCSGLMASGCS